MYVAIELSDKRHLETPWKDMPYHFRRDMMFDFDTYWVSATHPDQPNWSGNSRGRKRHLALSNVRGDLTLCNMLVDEPFSETIDVRIDDSWNDHWVDNGLCSNCQKTYNKTARKGHKVL